MITDSQCNKVYFSSKMPEKCPIAYNGLISVLDKYGVEHGLIENTNDIWCRDFMPVQVSDSRFCGFTYDPDYLYEKAEWIASRTDGNARCKELGFDVCKLTKPIKIDGGNVIRCNNKIIMIDKVFKENEISYSKEELAAELEKHFDAEIIFLPWDKQEYYGHADGLVRYVGNNNVLLTNYSRYNKTFTKKVTDILKQHFDNVYALEYHVAKQHKYNWAYINWLQTCKVMILPSFGCEEDTQALEQISSYMPEYKGRIEMADARDLIKHEGCFNCSSWTILSAPPAEAPAKGRA